jgi:uncharacterized small protein (DUF1192 family)
MAAAISPDTLMRGAALVAVLACALSPAAPAASTDAAEPVAELYRWLDQNGDVRYSPDLDRVPSSRRSTVVRVIPESIPSAAAAAPAAAPSASSVALSGADPFNAPGQARAVETQDVASDAATGGRSWPELDARIAELEALVARDEAARKEMISAPPTGDDDALLHSDELREIGARLPVLQAELAELKRWRDEPDSR